jgi:hypothetical protein
VHGEGVERSPQDVGERSAGAGRVDARKHHAAGLDAPERGGERAEAEALRVGERGVVGEEVRAGGHGRRLTASRATESAPHDTPHDAARESAESTAMMMQ